MKHPWDSVTVVEELHLLRPDEVEELINSLDGSNEQLKAWGYIGYDYIKSDITEVTTGGKCFVVECHDNDFVRRRSHQFLGEVET